MANYNVDIEVAIKHANSIDTLRKKIEALEKEYRKLGVGSKLEIGVQLGGLKKELALHDEIEGRLKRRQRLEETISRQRSARIEREKSRRATSAAGLAPATTAPAGPDVRLRSYQESIEKAVAAETQIRNLVNSTNISYDLRRQQTERIGKQRRQQMNTVDRELSFEKRLNATLERRGKIIDKNGKIRDKGASGGGPALSKRANAALTAGAFPLLFGGGAFTALGGAVGGAATGQLFGGATVAFQVIGSAVDTFAAKMAGLGQALNSLDPDVNAVVDSLGIAGTSTEKYINMLTEAGREQDAYNAAVAELTALIGTNGVQALEEFGSETQQLLNELTKMFTLLGSGLADLINQSGLLAGAGAAVERSNLLKQAERSSDPELKKLVGEFNAPKPFAAGEALQARRDLLNQIVERQRELNAAREAELAIEAQKKVIAGESAVMQQVEVNLLNAQIELAASSQDLLDDKVFGLHEAVIQREFEVELQKAINDGLDFELIFLDRKLALQDLINKRRSAEEREAESRRRKAEAAARKAAGEAERQAKRDQAALESAVSLEQQFAREVELRRTTNEFDQKRLEIQFEYEDRLARIEGLENKIFEAKLKQNAEEIRSLDRLAVKRKEAETLLKEFYTLTPTEEVSADLDKQLELLQAQILGKEEEFLLSEKLRDVELEGLDVILNKIAAVEELTAAREEQLYQERQLEELVNGMGRETLSLFENLIFATEDFNKSLANTLRSLATMVLRYGINAAAGSDGAGLFSFLAGSLKFRANGGPVTGNRPYIVGERGPELFVPGASGNVVPNHAMGGANVTVNVDASGTQAQGNQPNAKLLGQAIGAAVQAELIKQKRPGGLLAV